MSEEKIKTLMQTSVDKLHDMFNLAWDCNKSDETRTSLSRMVTDYITHVNQDFSWLIGIVEDISEDRLRELAAAEREGRLVVLTVPPDSLVYAIRENWLDVGDGECSKGYDCPICSPSRCEFYRRNMKFRGCEIIPVRVLPGISERANEAEKKIGKDWFLTEEAAKAKSAEIEAALSAGKGE